MGVFRLLEKYRMDLILFLIVTYRFDLILFLIVTYI